MIEIILDFLMVATSAMLLFAIFSNDDHPL